MRSLPGRPSLVGSPAVPVVDACVLRRLGTELADHAAARRVAGRFLDLLPVRTRSLTRAVRGHDAEAALELALTLKVTAATVGGRRLEAAARELESHLRTADWLRVRAAVRRLRAECAPLRASLTELLGT